MLLRKKLSILTAIAAFYLFCNYNLYGQLFTDDLNMGGGNMNNQFALIDQKKEYDKIKGSPFVFQDFEKGSVKFFSKEVNDVPLRVNLLNNKIEFLRRNNVYRFTNYDSVKLFNIGNRIFIPSKKENIDEYSVYELIHETDKYKLVKLQSYFLQEKIASKSSYEKEIPAQFVENSTKYFFFSVNNRNKLIEISDKRQIKKDEVLPYSPIKRILRGNRLKSDQDVIIFFNELNESDLLRI